MKRLAELNSTISVTTAKKHLKNLRVTDRSGYSGQRWDPAYILEHKETDAVAWEAWRKRTKSGV